jgi:TolB-like protein/class 3 adenylate cyclase/Flp pilus assembly protein TadD
VSSEAKQDRQLEIAHVLFIDIVGYSKLPINRQSELLQQLNQVVRATEQFRRAEAADKLVRLPTGDGMALAFFTSPDAPVRCALELGAALKSYPQLKLRMGINSGPVDAVSDVNDRSNVAGAGINMARRVMDCGDAGHILLAKRVADDLGQYENWQPYLHELGAIEVKHGVRVEVVNFYDEEVGNPELPEKVKRTREEQGALDHRASSIAARKRSLMIGLLSLVVVGIVAGSWLLFHWVAPHSTDAVSVSIPDKSIAVLPLENLSEEKENAYFADGIQDELLSNLAKIKDLKVISRTSVMQYKTGITRNLKEIAQQLGVSNVIEGSVRRFGNHVRVSVQLIDALADRHIWAQNYDRTLADSLALQGDLATEIAASVGATLSPQEKSRVEATPTNNTAAYDAYLRGRVFTGGQSDRANVEGAIRSYQEAVKLDPSFTLAWAYLSCAQSMHYWSGFDPSPARLAAAKDAVDRALALDPNLPETHLALGYYRYYGDRDFSGALAEFHQAEQGLPNNVDVVRAIALIQRRVGHWDEAIAGQRRAVELDPRNIDASIALATTCMVVRRFPEVLATADRVLALEPTNTIALWMKAEVFWARGDLKAVEPLLANPGIDPLLRGVQALFQRDYAAATEILSKTLADKPYDDERKWLLFRLGLSQQRAGNVAAARATYEQAKQDAQRELEKVARDSFQEAELRSDLGRAYAGLGEEASAVAEGQKGMAMDPTSKDPLDGPSEEYDMAQIYAFLGDADHAIPVLQRLLQIPAGGQITTPAILRIDPVWDPIRNDPRFQELTAEKKP